MYCYLITSLAGWLTHGEWVISILTSIYVLLTGVYVYFSHRMLKAIEKQAASGDEQLEIAKKAADAAKQSAVAAQANAQFLRNAERAYVDVEFAQVGSTGYLVNVLNVGRSLAIINTFTLSRSSFAKEAKDLTVRLGEHVETTSFHQILPVGQRSTIFEFDVSLYLSEEELSGEKTAIYRGIVEYSDNFGHEHETASVYSYQRSTSRLVNLPRYNKYT
jgi:hypothetical protein